MNAQRSCGGRAHFNLPPPLSRFLYLQREYLEYKGWCLDWPSCHHLGTVPGQVFRSTREASVHRHRGKTDQGFQVLAKSSEILTPNFCHVLALFL